MRANEERIAAMHKRAAELEKENRQRRVRIIQAVSAAACFAAVIVLAFFMPGFSQAFVSGNSQGSMSASIFSESSALGYIVIGILAFLLGAAVTIFCFRLKKWQKDKERQPGSDEGLGSTTGKGQIGSVDPEDDA